MIYNRNPGTSGFFCFNFTSKFKTMKNKLLYWSPRILGILAILFMMMFSIDCFEMGGKDAWICLLMHNIPAFITIVVLIVAWKWELIGGIIFMIASFAGAVYFNGFGGNWGVLPVMFPFLLTGILFILHYYLYLSAKQQS
jgi:hypothetical protein